MKAPGKRRRGWTWLCWGVVVLSLAVLGWVAPVERGVAVLRILVEQAGAWGPLLFGLTYVLASLLLIPAILLTLAAGALFGFGPGVVAVSASSVAAAASAFVIARHLARGAVRARFARSSLFAAVDAAVTEGGWKVVALLRFSPVIPFVVQNYLLGLTGVSLRTFVFTSWLAMLPATALYVGIGAVGGRAARGELGAGRWALAVFGVLATLGLTVYLTRIANQKLRLHTSAAAASRGPEGEAPGDEQTQAPGVAWKLPSVAVLAACLAAAGVLGQERWGAWLGPPHVKMTEAHRALPGAPAFDHSPWAAVLDAHVDAEGRVDYQALAADPAPLLAYLDALASANLEALGRDERLALLLNAYNAFTLQLLLEHPGIDSIRSIPADQRWDAVRWNLAGERVSLAELEHERIRPNFVEPRIHFALVCAAVGCPPLRREPYTGARLEQQLEAQTRTVFTRGSRWFEADGDTPDEVWVTALLHWYRDDFEQGGGTLLGFVADRDEGVQRQIDEGKEPAVRMLPYDWALNHQPGRATASHVSSTNPRTGPPARRSND